MAEYASKQFRMAGRPEYAVQHAEVEDARAWDDAPRGVPGKRTLVEHHYGDPLSAWDSSAPVQLRGGGRGGDPAAVHASAQRGIATAATELPYRDIIQRAFGRHDVSAIRAHTSSEAAASARAMGAEAYATGSHVVLGAGQDLFTVAHEAAHVVQQRAGVSLKAGVGEVGDAHEQHADEVAHLVVQGKSAEALLDRYAGAAGDGAALASGPVQRKVGFEAELCVPSLGPPPGSVDMKRLAPGPEGQQPTPAIEQFLFGGLGYGIALGGNEYFDLKPDHNELQGKATNLWVALRDLKYLRKLPTATMSNLEYVTKAIDELAPGSDLVFEQQFAAIRDHANALFPAAQQQVQSIGAPGAATYTGIPLADLQHWLGSDYWLVESEVDALRDAIRNEFGLQATVGIIPSAIRDLHKRHTPAADELNNTSVIEFAMFEVDRSLEQIIGFAPFKDHPYVRELRDGKDTASRWGGTTHQPARPIDYEAFLGVLHLMLMYKVGSALNQTSLLDDSTSKNAVPFLSKMKNMRYIITSAAPGLQAHRPPSDLIAYIDHMFSAVAATKLSWWLTTFKLQDRSDQEERKPIVEASFVSDMLAGNLLWPEAVFGGAQVKTTGTPRDFARPDKLPDGISQASGDQQGAQFEYRYIKNYPPADGLAAELGKVVDEVRALNMKHLSTTDQCAIYNAAAYSPEDDSDDSND